MKRISLIVLCLYSSALAQDRWIGNDPVGGGSIFLYPEPAFAPDSVCRIYADLGYPIDDLRIYYECYQGEQESLLPESLSIAGYNDIGPYMTADGSRLYFSSNRPGGFGGYDIWTTEKVGGVWSMPSNPGNEINSARDDLSPSLTANENDLFFIRGTFAFDRGAWGHIFKSSFQDGHWTASDSISAPVFSAYDDASPSISSDGNWLYFISKRPNGIPKLDYAAWVSTRDINNNWSEPVLLTGYINEYILQWCGCILDSMGMPTSCEISSNSDHLLYNKLDWYIAGGICYDPEDNFFLSYREVAIGDPLMVIPDNFGISLYPNPFNSSLAINIDGAVSEIAIYDLLGRGIRRFSGVVSNPVIWNAAGDDGAPCASGMYFVKASSGARSIVRPVTLLK